MQLDGTFLDGSRVALDTCADFAFTPLLDFHPDAAPLLHGFTLELSGVELGGAFQCGMTITHRESCGPGFYVVGWDDPAESVAGSTFDCEGVAPENGADLAGYGVLQIESVETGETAGDLSGQAIQIGVSGQVDFTISSQLARLTGRLDFEVLDEIVPDGDVEQGDCSAIPVGNWTEVSVGRRTTCAVNSDQQITCAGENQGGELYPPEGLSLVQVSVGDIHACGVTTEQGVVCWGGGGDAEQQAELLSAPSGSFQAVAVWDEHSCGLASDGSIECWGCTWGEQCTPPSGSFTAVDVDQGTSCGLTTDGQILCWGYQELSPPQGSVYTSLALGAGFVCGLNEKGDLECFHGSAEVILQMPGPYTALAAADDYICVLGARGAECWLASDGSLNWGRPHTPGELVRIGVGGRGRTCAINTGGFLFCRDPGFF